MGNTMQATTTTYSPRSAVQAPSKDAAYSPMHANGTPVRVAPLLRGSHGEGSPAYAALEHLLTTKYRIERAEDINTIAPNASRGGNMAVRCAILPRVLGVRTFEVPKGQIRLADDGSGNYEIYGPGVHRRANMFMSLGKNIDVVGEVIRHGDRTIVTVKQGHIGYCEDMGQPVLLPPGLHEWQSQTLRFIESLDLNNAIIRLGPYTLITVDEGYCAVTQNNGQQVILPGGRTHLLNHRNWKYEKMMTQMMQTDATVVWRVSNVDDAAKYSAETMSHDGKDSKLGMSDISKLRNDVLKQATASLAAFIGEIRYSDSFHISAAGSSSATAQPIQNETQCSQSIFDVARMASAVEAANLITQTYGVTILSINIISAVPADKSLQQALAKGAVASADAERAETVAHGEAKAVRIRAEADAEAERIRAAGAKEAAELLSTNPVAVDLAKISKVGEALKGAGSNTMFFGSDASALGSLMSNPAVVNPAAKGH